mgnify:CR=1 FL=1
MKSKEKPTLRSYKDARAEKQKDNLQKKLDEKIETYDNDMIDKLSKLMNQFDIGESMPIEGDLQVIPETKEPEQTKNLKELNVQPDDEGDSDLARSLGNDDCNPFTKESNFIGYHTTEQYHDNENLKFDHEYNQKYSATTKDDQNLEEEEDWEDEQDFTDFPPHIKNRPSQMEPNLLRPLSSKHSDRYSKQ